MIGSDREEKEDRHPANSQEPPCHSLLHPNEPREPKRETGRLRTRVVPEFAGCPSVALAATSGVPMGRVGLLERMRAHQL